ncbi:MAG TPA: hypothetical protein VF657_08360 [Actinoplanes sp.]|jgi:hypothetical protein
MASWRLARSLDILRDEVNDRWPNRSKVSDGTLGDTAHSSRTSDHNPSPAGVVRALDITGAGIDVHWYAEHIRQLGASGHPALQNHGYVIFNHRAAYATRGWQWVPYTGANAHTQHVHVSVGRSVGQYDSTVSWGVRSGAAPQRRPTPRKDPDMTPAQEAKLHARLDNFAAELADMKRTQADVQRTQTALVDAVLGAPVRGGTGQRHAGMAVRIKYLADEILRDGATRIRALLDGAS